MSQEAVQENKMGTMPVNKLLITMSIPMIISMLVQAFYNVVDSIFVAQISENALTAVSMAFPIQNLMIAVATGTGVGVNALLSKSLGEKNQKLADKTANNSVFLAVMSYVAFLIFGLVGTETFFRLQTDIPEIIEYGRNYLFICSVLSFGIFGQSGIGRERLLLPGFPPGPNGILCHTRLQKSSLIIHIRRFLPFSFLFFSNSRFFGFGRKKAPVCTGAGKRYT